MIDRYSTPEMRALWSAEARTQRWLEVEIAVCAGLEAYAYIPPGTTEAIRAKARFDLDRMAELERETRHDVMAFVKNVQDKVEYLVGGGPIKIYRGLFLVLIGVGAVLKLDLVWGLADIFNGLMALPNLIALLFLTPVLVA